MPEGPTIRRIADCLRDKLQGQRAHTVRIGVANQKRHEATLSGRRIEDVRSFGKAMVFDLEDGWSVFTHTQLYGRWFVVPAGQQPPGKKKLGIAFDTDAHTAILTSTNKIEVLRTAELGRHSFIGKLGPDALDPQIGVEEVRRQLDVFGAAPIGQTLLDQAFMAGIGNYLRSEILYLAKLRPEHTPESLNPNQRDALAEQILAAPRRAYTAQGFTTSQAHIDQGQARGLPLSALKRYVYEHAGDPCPTCAAPIQEEQFDGRRIFLCASCQR